MRGMVVETIRQSSTDNAIVQECAVDFSGERRWFLAEHLVRVAPENLVRFFRAGVSERWDLDPEWAICLDGRRDQLTTMLLEWVFWSSEVVPARQFTGLLLCSSTTASPPFPPAREP